MKALRLAAAICALTAPITASGADDAARRFGARQDIWAAMLSPDGKQIAFLRPTRGAGAAVFIGDLTTGGEPKPILASSGHPDRLTGCNWVTVSRLVCSVYMISDTADGKLSYTRLVTLNSDGSDVKQLSARTSSSAYGYRQDGGSVIDFIGDGKDDGTVLMTRQFGEEASTGTMFGSQQHGLGIELVDSATLKRRTVLYPNAEAMSYISDGRGTIRVMGVMPRTDRGYLRNQIRYLYRPSGGGDWKPLSTVTTNLAMDDGFSPVAVDPDSNVAYGFDNEHGHVALFKIALDGSLKRDLVLAQPDADVESLMTIGRQDRVIGATFATDKRTTLFFDPELKALGTSLSKALPQFPLIDFVDASAGEKQLLLFVGSDSDPGHYFLFDKASKKLSELFAVRPQLAAVPLASVKSITFKAADGTMIPAYLTLPPGSDGKNLPAIVMPHGGPASRDEWGFDWLSQYFTHQGYAVLQPEFRGSAGYGEVWFQKNGFQSWKIAIGDVNDAGRYLLSSGIAAPGKIGIFGWSYGGYAALQSSVLDPDLFKAIVAVAPVTDLDMIKEQARRFTNFRLVEAEIGSGPHIIQGSPLQNADRIKAPVLLFHGDQDLNVSVEESRAMASKLKSTGKQVDYVEFKGLDHQLDDESARAELLQKASDLFKKTIGQ